MKSILARLPGQPVTAAQQEQARGLIQAAARSQTRAMQTDDLPGLLYERYEHPQWDDVAARCLSCSNCALVCPTCFCHAIVDQVDLEGGAGRTLALLGCLPHAGSFLHPWRLDPDEPQIPLPPMVDP